MFLQMFGVAEKAQMALMACHCQNHPQFASSPESVGLSFLSLCERMGNFVNPLGLRAWKYHTPLHKDLWQVTDGQKEKALK